MDNVVAPPVSGVLVPASSAVTDSAPLASTALRVSKVALGVSQPGSLGWRAERARNSSWLAVVRTQGTAPDTLEIRLDPAGLAEGVYRDTVILSTNNYEAPPLRVPVEFSVHPCRVTPVPLDTVVNAPLSGAECGAPHTPGTFARVFGFAGVAGDSLTLELVATGFDAKVVLDTVPAPGAAPPLAQATACRGVVGDPCIPYLRLPRTGTYFVEVSGSTPPAGGTFVLHVKAPKPPGAPEQPRQSLADTVTVIATGAVVAAQPIVINATLSDPDIVDTLRLELELRPTTAAFTGTPTHTSATVTNGARAAIVTTVPDDSSYHWRARTADQTGRRSDWLAFGANPETAADFTTAVPQAPAAPASLAQLRGNDQAPMAVGGASPVTAVTFRAVVTDPDPGDQLRLEIELRPVGTAFTNVATHQSAPVALGGTAEVAVPGLTDNTLYHWQARVVDQTSRASAWTAFGGNPELNPDFRIAIPATQLVFSVQPVTTTAAFLITPAIKVTALDANGQPAVSFADTITLALGAPSGGATLSGTLRVPAILGVATFTVVSVDKAGTGYTLVAAAPTLPGVTVTSTPFNINAGTATQLTYTVQPSTVVSAEAMAPAVQVQARDGGGNPATGFNGTVSIAIGTNPSGGTLSGTLTAQASAGLATFPNLRIDKVGTGYTLVASFSGLTSATSTGFDVTPAAAASLEFTQQSLAGDAGLPLVPAAQVTARDAQGNVATGFTDDVTIAIGANPGAGSLSGTTTRAAVAGVATFPGLSIDLVGTGYTFVATAGLGIAADTSAPFEIRAANAERLVFRIHPADAIAGAPLGSPVQVGVQDAFGNLATGFNGSVTMVLNPNAAGGTLGGTVTVAVVAGLANFADLFVDKVGAGYTLTAGATGLPSDTSDAFAISHAAANHLTFTQQPPLAITAGVAMGAVMVTARDPFGNRATSFTGDVALALGSNPGGSTLDPLVVAAVSGVATFSGVSLEKVGTGYMLTATTTGLSAGTSAAFDVTPAAATQLAFTAQPSNAVAAVALAPAVRVTARDQFGNTATRFSGDVTVAIAANPGSGTLGGTTTSTAVAGVATFANLSIDKAGSGYTLSASGSGVSSATSTTFNITAGPAIKLAFTVQPSNDAAGSLITPAVQVSAVDANDNTTPDFTGTVTVALGANPGAGTLSGTLVAPMIGGVATFGTLSIDKTGAGYTLTATTTGLTGATSAPFTIVPAPATHLVFTVQPSNIASGSPFVPAVRVTARDAQQNVATGFTGNVTIGIAANPANGALLGTTTVAAVAGVATFPGLSINTVGAGYSLSAAAAGAATAASATFDVTAGDAAQLVFTVQPSNATAGVAIAPPIQITVRDAQGNLATGYADRITLHIGENPGDGALLGTTSLVASGGVVSFPSVAISRSGTGYTLVATATGVADSTSSAPFDIAAGPATQLAFTRQPTPTVAAANITPAVQVNARDALGNTATSFTGDITVALQPNPWGGTLSGTKTVAAVEGVATFTDLSIDKAGPGHQLSAAAGGLTGGTSAFFAITPDAPAQLVFTEQPIGGIAGVALSPPIDVTAFDSHGNVATQFTGDVTMTLGTNPTGATLSGETVRAALGGVARFTTLKVDSAGLNYRLAASAPGLTTANSAAFGINFGPATQLAFAVQPTDQLAGAPLAPTVRVKVMDSQGNVVRNHAGSVTLTLTNPNGATLGGAGPVAVVDGLATFPALNVNQVGTGYELHATSGTLTSATSAPFNITHAAPSVLLFIAQPTSAQAATTIAPSVQVQVRDAFGNVATGYNGSVTVAIGTNPGGGTLLGATTTAAVAGVATFGTLSIDKSGTGYTLSASFPGMTQPAPISAPFTITPGPATQLAFTVSPGATSAGAAIAPAVQVTARDGQGNTATGFNGTITVAMGNNPGGGTLSGTNQRTAVAGVATFAGLSIEKAGTGYTLIATLAGLTSATSAAFTIIPEVAAQLVFTGQPANATAGVAIAPPVQVTARDIHGNTATAFTGIVTIAIGANPGGSVLGGTATAAAVAGVATFSGLSLNKTGTGYTLTANTPSALGATSAAFNITPGPATQLAFTVQPVTTVAGTAITPAVQVTARDAQGNSATSFSGAITVAIGTNPGGGVLTGTLQRTAVAGVATFPGLSIDKAGTGYTLSATATGLTSGTANAFTITPDVATQLAFTVQPANTTAGVAFAAPLQVTARDAHGNTSTAFNGPVTIAIESNPGASTLTGTATVSAVAGIATFPGLSLNRTGNGYTLNASSGGLSSVTSALFNITPGPASSLVFSVQPSGATAGLPITPPVVVTAQDNQGNTATGFTGAVTVALAANPAGGTLGGATTVAATAGVATFSTLTINLVGSGYSLNATAGGVSGVISNAFNVAPAVASSLVFTVQPTNTTAGAAIAPPVVVTARDNQGNIAAGFTGNVTVAIETNPGAGTLGGITTVAAVGGIATFPNLSLNRSGTGYTLSASFAGMTQPAPISTAFNVNPGPASQLAFTVSPGPTVAGAAMTPPVQVTARDNQGNTATSFNGTITVAIGTNPGAGTLSGTVQVAAVAGVATFPNLSIDKAGTGYTLGAAASGLTSATSAAFSIVPGLATQLAFTVQPTSATAGAAIAPAIQVTARDAHGNTATSFDERITLSIGTNPGGGTLIGAPSLVASAGVVSFSAVGITRSGTGYTLVAAGIGVADSATSAPFNITGGTATQLAFTTQPTTTAAGAAITPAVQVTARDGFGNAAPGFTGNVTVTLMPNPWGGTLAGTTTVAAVAGVATFPGLRVDKVGDGHQLAAAAQGLTATTSAFFAVTPGTPTQLAFTVQPVGGTAGVTLTPTIEVTAFDAHGNLATQFAGDVTMGFGANPNGGTLSGTTVRAAVAGVARFDNLSIDKAGPNYRLAGSAAGLTTANSALFSITSNSATQLAFGVQPSDATAGAAIAPTVRVNVLDAFGNLVGNHSAGITLTLTNPNGAVLSGGGPVIPGSGFATFSSLSVNQVGTYTLQATSPTVAGAVSTSFTVSPAAASALVFLVQPPAQTVAGASLTPAIAVQTRDPFGNIATGFTGTVTLAIAANPGGSTLSGINSRAAVAGVATFPGLSLNASGAGYTLGATSVGVTGATSSPFSIVPGNATQLAFTTQPVNTVAGVTMTPAVRVTAQDAQGNTATSFTGPVTIALGVNPGGGVLTGGGAVAAVAGVVTLPSLSINAAGVGYTLTATGGGLPQATSTAFNITTGAASQLVFTVQPTSATAGVANAPPVQVTARDNQGNTVTSFTGNVTIALGANPGGSVLTGNPVVAAVAGVATFSNLRLNRTGNGYTFSASAAGVPGTATSAAFNIAHAPASVLVFTTQPTSATAGVAINPVVQVTARDSMGNTATGFTGNVTVALGTNPGGSVLLGNPVVAAAAGVATFPNLRLNRTGTGYTLTASAGGVAGGATSAAFNIAPAPASTLVFTAQPTNTTAGVTISPAVQVTARDSMGNTATSFAASVAIALGTNPGGGVLTGGGAVAAVAGVVTLPALSINAAGAGYTLTANSVGLPTATSSAFTVAPGAASQLVFTVQPTSATAGVAIGPPVQVTARDNQGNTVTSFTGNVTMALGANPGGSTLTGNPVVAAVAGVATFPNLRLNRTGTGYTFTASAAGVAGTATSTAFNIAPAPASVLVFTTPPTTTSAGAPFSPAIVVTARDSMQNTATSFAGNVLVAIGTNPVGGTLSGPTSIPAVAGVATFPGLSVNKTGTGYTLIAAASGLVGATSPAFNINPGVATQLVFTVQPSSATAGMAIAPAFQVTARDAQGNVATGYAERITLSIGTNPNAGVLMGSPSLVASAGVVNFNSVGIDHAGNGYTLVAAGIGIADSATSAPFNIVAGAATQLAFTVQPTPSVAGASISPAIEVRARDGFGNTATTFNGNINVTLQPNPWGGVLSGTTTRAAVAGVATFPALSIDVAGPGHQLAATATGLTTATSVFFAVTPGAPAQLAFTFQPVGGTAGVALTPIIDVTVFDAQGNVATQFSGNVTMTIGANPNGGTLSGTTVRAAVAGVARFTDLSIDKAGSNYRLAAGVTGLPSANSALFTIAPAAATQLVFAVQPSDAVAGVAITPTVRVDAVDAFGNLVGSFAGSITLALTNPNGAILTGGGPVAVGAGFAAFPSLSVNQAGTYSLAATSGGLSGATSSTFTITSLAGQ